MKLNVINLGVALATIWALATLSAGVANIIWPGYGVEFLKLLDSLYPGYHLVVIAWIYNLCAKCFKKEKE